MSVVSNYPVGSFFIENDKLFRSVINTTNDRGSILDVYDQKIIVHDFTYLKYIPINEGYVFKRKGNRDFIKIISINVRGVLIADIDRKDGQYYSLYNLLDQIEIGEWIFQYDILAKNNIVYSDTDNKPYAIGEKTILANSSFVEVIDLHNGKKLDIDDIPQLFGVESGYKLLKIKYGQKFRFGSNQIEQEIKISPTNGISVLSGKHNLKIGLDAFNDYVDDGTIVVINNQSDNDDDNGEISIFKKYPVGSFFFRKADGNYYEKVTEVEYENEITLLNSNWVLNYFIERDDNKNWEYIPVKEGLLFKNVVGDDCIIASIVNDQLNILNLRRRSYSKMEIDDFLNYLSEGNYELGRYLLEKDNILYTNDELLIRITGGDWEKEEGVPIRLWEGLSDIRFDASANASLIDDFINGKLMLATMKYGQKFKDKNASEINYFGRNVDGLFIRIEIYPNTFSTEKIRDFESLIRAGQIVILDQPAPSKTPESTSKPPEITKTMSTKSAEQIKDEITTIKKELNEWIGLRNVLEDTNPEEIVMVNSNIYDKSKELARAFFEKTEEMVSSNVMLDQLFEQSFTELKQRYPEVFATEFDDFFTPNGKRSAYSEDINRIIRSPQFKEWFGDWEEAYALKGIVEYKYKSSVVVTPDAEPQIVWHGTNNPFSYFKFDSFPAAYFAVNPEYSVWFAEAKDPSGGYVYPFFLNVRNPLDLSMFGIDEVSSTDFFSTIFIETGLKKEDLNLNPVFMDDNLRPQPVWVYLRNNPSFLQTLRDKKLYDGIHFYEFIPNLPPTASNFKTEAWIIFSPENAKLADPERGQLMLASLKSFILRRGGKI